MPRRTDTDPTGGLAQSLAMWGKVLGELRKAGPKKIALFAIVAAAAVIFAYGNNSTNDAANGKTLPRTVLAATHHPYRGTSGP